MSLIFVAWCAPQSFQCGALHRSRRIGAVGVIYDALSVVFCVRVGARFDEQTNHFDANRAGADRVHQRRFAALISAINGRARLQKNARDFDLIPLDGAVKQQS